MKNQLRNGDTLVVSDVDRIGRNADDVIVEIKNLQSKGIRVVVLDFPFLNDWEKMNDDSLSKMIIDIFVTLKAHIAQQEKEKIHDRAMQGLEAAEKKGKKLGRPATGVSKEFIKEYNKFQSGEYGSISVVQFAKLQGIAVSTFYKYSDIAVTLNVYTHVGLEDAENELRKMQTLEGARKEMGLSDKDDKSLKQTMFKVV